MRFFSPQNIISTNSYVTSTEKNNFRKRKAWKDFRETFKSEHDALTDKKLSKKFNLHHCSLDPTKYDDLSNRDNFLPLNSQSHDCVHFLFRYYQKDPDIINRLKAILDKMAELNKPPTPFH